LHLTQPWKPVGAASPMSMPGMYLVASVLLLIGMGHLETFWSERRRADALEQHQRSEWNAEIQRQVAELKDANGELFEAASRSEHRAQALAASEAEYQALFIDNPAALWLVDLRSGQILGVNEATLQLYGYERKEFMALTARRLAAQASAAAFQQDLTRSASGKGRRGLWQHCRKDGTSVEVELSCVDLRFGTVPARLMLAQDLAAQRQRERELCARARADAVAQVAGGVAHHFNNLLAVIKGNVEILQQRVSASPQLESIATAGQRAAGLTRQLLAAAGCQLMEARPLDLNAALRQLNPLLARLLGDGVTIHTASGAALPAIVADPHSVEHIVVNLVLNARDAMPTGGSLDLVTSLVSIGQPPAQNPQARPGEFVRLTVADSGRGMKPEVQARIFEPFFTTHDVGQRIGLGLASVQGTIRQLGGWIEFSSRPQVGTQFHVFFPCATRS